MTEMNGGSFISGFTAGALSSIASSLWGGGSTKSAEFDSNWKLSMVTTHHQGLSGFLGANNTFGLIAFGTVSGGAGAALTGGNFWQGAVTGLVVSLLNHAAHSIGNEGDDGYDKNGKYINDNGGDLIDYKYDDNGNIIDSQVVKTFTVGHGSRTLIRSFGYKLNGDLATGACTDDSLNFTSNLFGIGEIYKGAKLAYMGLTTLSKASLGLKVLGGASSTTLKSSVYYKSIYGSQQINLLGGAVKSLPYLNPSAIGTTTYWSSFYGRNAALFGVGRVGIGATVISH